jgi:hypothetical protein
MGIETFLIKACLKTRVAFVLYFNYYFIYYISILYIRKNNEKDKRPHVPERVIP